MVFVAGICPQTTHGGGLRVFDMIHEMILKGHEIHLYTSSSQLESGEDVELLKSICKSFNIIEPQNFTQDNLEQWLEKNDHYFDVAFYIWPWTVNLFPNNKTRIKKIAFEYIECTVRRLWLDLQSFTLDTPDDKIRNTLYDFYTHYYCEMKAAKEADILVSVSDKDALFIKNIYADSSATVIPTGLSRFEFQNFTQSQPTHPFPSACFIGNYFHYPNLDGLEWYLGNIHGIILQSVPNYKFGILGKGNDEAINKLKNKYKHFADSLDWVGPVDKVAPALSPYTICLSPLISGAGLRGKVIQYSALKKATVSTYIGICGTPFVHKDSIFASDDPVDFAQYAIQLLTNENLRNSMAQKALEVTEKDFSWAASIKSLETFFQKGTK
jgi:glycosyltransferase involved in cell wall biosynthesis